MTHARRCRAEWKRLVAAFEAGGSSVEAFAGENDVGVETLKWWRSRLRHSSGSRAVVRFARVELAVPVGSALERAAQGPWLDLPGGCTLHFGSGIDSEYVANVVAGTAARLGMGGARC